jgi:hypothetical protein
VIPKTAVGALRLYLDRPNICFPLSCLGLYRALNGG